MNQFVLGYCTNVHSGTTLATTLEALDRHATAVRQFVKPVGQMSWQTRRYLRGSWRAALGRMH